MFECKQKEFNNNTSLEVMKFQWVLDQGGMWFGSMVNGKVIAVSGTHPDFLDGWRIFYRSAQLASRKDIKRSPTLAHNHFIYDHIFYEIEHAEYTNGGETPVYCTSGSRSSATGRYRRASKQLWKDWAGLEELDLISHWGRGEVFGETQDVWEVHGDAFRKVFVTRPDIYPIEDILKEF